MRVQELFLQREKQAPLQKVRALRLIAGVGIEGSFHCGGDRQIILWGSAAKLEAGRLGHGFCMHKFHANMIIDGLEQVPLQPGDRLSIGNCVIAITHAGKHCFSHQCALFREDVACPLQSCFYAVAEQGGMIYLGDSCS